MILGATVLAVIPARGGSKGVPRKNVRPVSGLPLIGWTINAAMAAASIDRIIVSSDDAEIISVAKECGAEVPFVRDAALSDDHALTMDVVLDALERCPGFSWVVLLQPTSPLRSAGDIEAAIRCCLDADAPACVSVCRASESPYWMYTLAEHGRMSPLLSTPGGMRRQDLPPVYSLNGAVYVARTDWLRENRSFLTHQTVAYEMPPERSIDIDTEADFIYLETALKD